MLLMAMVAAAAVPGADGVMLTAYDALCIVKDGSPKTALALADRDGWQSGGAGAPKDFDASSDRFKQVGKVTIELRTLETRVRDERIDTCGISVASDQPDLAADVQTMLGFAPAFHLMTSSTFFAVREDGRWQEGSKLSRPDFAAAKAAGKFYSVMVNSATTGSAVFSLQIRPVTAD